MFCPDCRSLLQKSEFYKRGIKILAEDDSIVNCPTDEEHPLLLRMVLQKSERIGPGTDCRWKIEPTTMTESFDIINRAILLTKSRISTSGNASISIGYPTPKYNFYTIDIRGSGYDGRCAWCNYLKNTLMGKCNDLSRSMELKGRCEYGWL
jgi:hypothetical protein